MSVIPYAKSAENNTSPYQVKNTVWKMMEFGPCKKYLNEIPAAKIKEKIKF